MELHGSGRGREVLVTLNVERETGRIFRSDQLRQQYGSEQAPQEDPQLGSRYLIADVEAQQLMASAGLGHNGAPPGGEMVIPARGDLQETGKPGSYRLDPASVQPGEPMTPGTRQIEDRITTRAGELRAQGQTMSHQELGEIVERVHSEEGLAGPRPERTQQAPEQAQSGLNSQAGLASHRSGVPFHGVNLTPSQQAQSQQAPSQQAQSQQAAGRFEKSAGEPKKAPRRELPIPGMITSHDVPRSGAGRPQITEADGVVSATAKGFASGFQAGMQRQRTKQSGAATTPDKSDVAAEDRSAATERAEARMERFPELRGSAAPEGPTARRPELGDSPVADNPRGDAGPDR